MRWWGALPLSEAICLAFDVVPSELRLLFWRVTLSDIRVKLKLYLGQEQARIIQDFDSLALIVTQAFGGTGSKASGNSAEPVKERTASTADEIMAAFAGHF